MREIPNIISLIRLLGSVWSCGYIFVESNVYVVSGMLLLGIVTDMLDGYLARRLGAVSIRGHRLDLIADAFCFSLLPCVYILSNQASTLDLIISISLVIYTLSRIRTEDWVCKGIPLPIVGTMVFTVLFFWGKSLIAYVLEVAIIIISFISIFFL